MATSGNRQDFTVGIDFVAKNPEIFDKANKQAKETAQVAKSLKNAYAFQREELQKLNPELVKQIELQQRQANATQLQIRNLRAQAKEIRTSVALLKDSADDWDRLFKPLAAGGALLAGGILAFANNYVQGAERATKATTEWKAAQADLERSGARVGEVLAREALPLLQEAAKVTRQVAGVLEAHPEIARAALATGLVTLAVGTIGTAYTKGIRLVADLKLDAALTLQNRAAQLQLLASENQLKAAGIQAQSSGVKSVTPSGGGLAGAVVKVALVAIASEVGVFLGNKIGEAITGGKTGLAGKGGFGFADVAVAGLAATQTPSFLLLKGLNKLGVASDATVEKMRTNLTEFDRLAAGVLGANKILNVFNNLSPEKLKQNIESITPKFLGGSRENQDAAVQAFVEFRAEENRITRDAMEERKRIVAEGEAALVSITRNYTTQRTSIERQYSQAAAQITTRYQADVKKAEQDYQQERVQIAQDGNERIREIQQQEQEKREEIEREFAKASRSATADRDALALVQAQEARDEALAEADRGTSEAIQRERRETQERLQELATRYAQERQQRQAQYEADLKENAARRAAALKEANERYQAELKQAREANAQKLKEAAEAANRERIEKRNQFIAQLQDLGVTLNSERQLRNTAYNAMLSDLQNWLNQMGGVFTPTANSLGVAAGASPYTSSGGTASSLPTNPNFAGSGQYGTHDFTGYAYKGLYRMAQDGKPEWVLSGKDTAAAERAVGGQLTQGNMSQMISLFGAMRGSVNYAPTINSEVSARTRRDMEQSFRRSLDQMLGGY